MKIQREDTGMLSSVHPPNMKSWSLMFVSVAPEMPGGELRVVSLEAKRSWLWSTVIAHRSDQNVKLESRAKKSMGKEINGKNKHTKKGEKNIKNRSQKKNTPKKEEEKIA